MLSAGLDFLQSGQEELAEAEFRRVLSADPTNRVALGLMRQIREDPQSLLGRESFGYKVQPGETLSGLARRFLNDAQLFYALARYNSIKVPRTLVVGATIRVPGRMPTIGTGTSTGLASQPAPPPPQPGGQPAATTAAMVPVPGTSAAAVPGDVSRADRAKAETVNRQTRAARAAFAKQDLDGALRAWDAVLAADPDNRTAQLERQKTQLLKEKLGKVR